MADKIKKAQAWVYQGSISGDQTIIPPVSLNNMIIVTWGGYGTMSLCCFPFPHGIALFTVILRSNTTVYLGVNGSGQLYINAALDGTTDIKSAVTVEIYSWL